MAQVQFSVYRYNPDVDNAPRMQEYTLQTEEGQDMMVLDALLLLKDLAFFLQLTIHFTTPD